MRIEMGPLKMIQSIYRKLRLLKFDYYSVLLVLIVFLAIFFRIWNYRERVYIESDQTRFAQVALYAKDHAKLPLVGPFPQASFFTGPWWLWILMVFYLFPFDSLTPWYFMTILSFVFILLIAKSAYYLGGKKMAVVTALFAAVSTAQINNAFTVWNAGVDAYIGVFAIYFLINYIKSTRLVWMFLLAFSISLGTTIHFQTAYLVPLIFSGFFFGKNRLKAVVISILGFAIPLLPFLYFDLKFHWFETRQIIDYLRFAQYRIYVPNRWLTYISTYWPATWATIIGADSVLSGSIIAFLGFFSIAHLKNFKKEKIYYISVPFVLSIVMLRYYRGERLAYFSNYAHAWVLLLSAWVIVQIYNVNKLAATLLLLVIICFSINSSLKYIAPHFPNISDITRTTHQLYSTFPNTTFDIYGCRFSGDLVSYPVAYFLYYDGKNQVGGKKIGICTKENNQIVWTELTDTNLDTPETGWYRRSVEDVYQDVGEWWKFKPEIIGQ